MRISYTSRSLFLILIITLTSSFAFCQKTAAKDRNIKKNAEEIRFSTAWVWDFSNDFADRKGEMKVYVDTLTGTFLFTNEAYGNVDSLDFVIVGQDGVYKTGYTDEKGLKVIEMDTIHEVKSISEAKDYYNEDFNKRVLLTGQKKVFGENSNKWPVITGEEYKTTFEPPTSFSLDYLKKVNFSLLPMYFFNQRQEVPEKLPYFFSGALHMNYLLLENTYESDGKKITIVLRNVMPADKMIDLALYKK